MENVILEHFREYKIARSFLLIFDCKIPFLKDDKRILFINLKVFRPGQILLNGNNEGVVIGYYAPGKKYQEFFRNGLREGLAIIYDKHGKISFEEYYVHGKLTEKELFMTKRAR